MEEGLNDWKNLGNIVAVAETPDYDWVTTNSKCDTNIRQDWNRWKPAILCCWCKNRHVNTAGELCGYCRDLPSNPFVQMKKKCRYSFL